tara:strand:- start:392 stop:976 length:585 start_codon:yes stop_codon:yes gene_type:complete
MSFQFDVGVLAVQGSFAEHMQILSEINCPAMEVRSQKDLEQVKSLIIPGGESTTIGKLVRRFDLIEPILGRASEGMPIWGTCAGLICLAKDLGPSDPPILGLMDIKVQRNAYGRQIDSFETAIELDSTQGDPFHAVFIRAPIIVSIGPNVEVVATIGQNSIVAVEQDQYLATSFHPELTDDPRFHLRFVSKIKG